MNTQTIYLSNIILSDDKSFWLAWIFYKYSYSLLDKVAQSRDFISAFFINNQSWKNGELAKTYRKIDYTSFYLKAHDKRRCPQRSTLPSSLTTIVSGCNELLSALKRIPNIDFGKATTDNVCVVKFWELIQPLIILNTRITTITE